jgi:hypothetical protein
VRKGGERGGGERERKEEKRERGKGANEEERGYGR